MSISSWWKGRKLERLILNIALNTRVIEEENNRLVKHKIRYWKAIKKTNYYERDYSRRKSNDYAQEFARSNISLLVNRQRSLFLNVQQMFQITQIKSAGYSPIIVQIHQKMVEAHSFIDSMVNIYTQQLSAFNQENWKNWQSLLGRGIAQEFALYRSYQKLRRTVPREVMIELEVEWEKYGKYLKRKVVPPSEANEIIKDIFFGALQLGIMYLCIDNQHLKQILSRPDVITAVILGNIAWGKYVHLQRKMGLYVQQIHQQKPLLPI